MDRREFIKAAIAICGASAIPPTKTIAKLASKRKDRKGTVRLFVDNKCLGNISLVSTELSANAEYARHPIWGHKAFDIRGNDIIVNGDFLPWRYKLNNTKPSDEIKIIFNDNDSFRFDGVILQADESSMLIKIVGVPTYTAYE